MIADSIEVGKPTYVFSTNGSLVDRHVDFLAHHFKKGRIRVLENKLERFTYERVRFTNSLAIGIFKSLWPNRPPMCKMLF